MRMKIDFVIEVYTLHYPAFPLSGWFLLYHTFPPGYKRRNFHQNPGFRILGRFKPGYFQSADGRAYVRIVDVMAAIERTRDSERLTRVLHTNKRNDKPEIGRL